MRLPLLSLTLILAATGITHADDLPCISTTFNLLSPNDKVCVSEFNDPAVPGVACYVSQARKGGWGQPFGLNESVLAGVDTSVVASHAVSVMQALPLGAVARQLSGVSGRHQQDQ